MSTSREQNGHNWFLYVIECGDGSYYTGVTTDLARRIEQHRKGKGAKYVRGRGPLRYVAAWEYLGKSARSHVAIDECAFKKLNKSTKKLMVAHPSTWTYRASTIFVRSFRDTEAKDLIAL